MQLYINALKLYVLVAALLKTLKVTVKGAEFKKNNSVKKWFD